MVDHREKNEGAIVSFYTAVTAPGLRRWRLLVFLLNEIGDLILNDTNNRFSYFYSISRDTKMICLNVRLNFL